MGWEQAICAAPHWPRPFGGGCWPDPGTGQSAVDDRNQCARGAGCCCPPPRCPGGIGTRRRRPSGQLEDTRQLTLTLLQAVQTRTDVPLLASGGLMTPQDVQAVLQAGAVAAQCGTPFLLVHEASTSAP
ncbi:hypothetical protein EJ104_13450 [Deinococcus radiophilus]|uniref:Uncharacterized protein n=1 Tax=Deinococcus radiophilus TaxID=32062 RepID=A0A3S0K4C2_9DEIO|nr:hypothetical protein EJ104_13450 [Deinococcus radiophilus]